VQLSSLRSLDIGLDIWLYHQ